MVIIGSPLVGLMWLITHVLLPGAVIAFVLYCLWRGREARLRDERAGRSIACQRCGQPLSEGTVICTYCGTIQREPVPEQNAAQAGPASDAC